MSPVPATVPADAVLRTKDCRGDYSFFLLLLGANHSTIRPIDLRLSASKSVAPQTSAELPGAIDVTVIGVGHNALLGDREVFERTQAEIVAARTEARRFS